MPPRGNSHRVKFTAGPDSDSDDDTTRSPVDDVGFTQPPTIHRPSVALFERDTEPLPEYYESQGIAPPLTRKQTSTNNQDLERGDHGINRSKSHALHSAYDRAQRLASRVRRPSYLTRRKSTERETGRSSPSQLTGDPVFPRLDEKSDDNTPRTEPYEANPAPSGTAEAHQIVRQMSTLAEMAAPSGPSNSGLMTPHGDRDPDYVEAPAQYRSGILFNLLKLYDREAEEAQEKRRSSGPLLPVSSPSGESSGRNTPRTRKWYEKAKNRSTSSLNSLVHALPKERPGLKRSRSSGMIATAAKKFRKPRLEDEIRITVHIAETISRQRYLTKLCQALMLYGAPTHRLEDFLRMTARVLEIDAQFLYLPGCMFVSFGDATTHTSELKLLRYSQGVDLGRLGEVHQIYKEVVHDVVGVEEATQRLDEAMSRKQRYNKWWLILLYGCASATVGPFAFDAGYIEMPISFLLGCILGALNYLVAPRSQLYSNIFELTAAVVTSFLARAFGSIPYKNGYLFCFPALAQSSLALILPGYIVLCSSLELQSRNLLAGSVRLVYAIIYSLVLGFGMMLGTTFYGSMDHNASSEYTCSPTPHVNEYIRKFPFVILFSLCLIMINQAKWKQTPLMLLISFSGYIVNFFSARYFHNNTQIANALGAFVIGVMGNLYSRLYHGLAAAAILPAIFVQVPSGLAASGSLVSGLVYANAITHDGGSNASVMLGNGNSNNTSLQGGASELANKIGSSRVYGNVVFDLAYGMVQISIAITVGLFLAALVVYPLGKRRSGLFSF